MKGKGERERVCSYAMWLLKLFCTLNLNYFQTKNSRFIEDLQMNIRGITRHTKQAVGYCGHKQMMCCSDSNALHDKNSFAW